MYCVICLMNDVVGGFTVQQASAHSFCSHWAPAYSVKYSNGPLSMINNQKNYKACNKCYISFYFLFFVHNC